MPDRKKPATLKALPSHPAPEAPPSVREDKDLLRRFLELRDVCAATVGWVPAVDGSLVGLLVHAEKRADQGQKIIAMGIEAQDAALLRLGSNMSASASSEIRHLQKELRVSANSRGAKRSAELMARQPFAAGSTTNAH
mgnify:FL=1